MNVEEFKVALVGDTGVGKTCIAVRFVSNIFNIAQASTSGASFMRKTICVENKTVKFQLWDTAGQEKFRSLAPMYYRSAAAVIIVFDVTRNTSFLDVQYWVKEVKQNSENNAIIVMVGNKIDKSGRQVQYDEAAQLAKQLNAKYFETSAQTGDGVVDIFHYLAKQDLTSKIEKVTQIIEDEVSTKSKCC